MKLLFVHEISWLKKVVYEIHDIPELLALKGHEVTFLEYDEDDGVQEKTALVEKRYLFSKRSSNSRAHENSNVKIITPRRWLPGIFGRLAAVFIHPFFVLQQIIFHKPDVLFLYGVPTNGWQSVLLAKLTKTPVVFRAIDVSHEIRPTRLSKIIKVAESIVVKNSQLILTHNYALREYLVKFGIEPQKVIVLLPGVDLSRFQRTNERGSKRQELNIRFDDKVILFMGTLFKFSGVFEFLQMAANDLRKNPNTKILIVGDGEDKNRIQGLIQSESLENHVLMPGRIQYEELNSVLQTGDIAVLPFIPQDVTHMALPGKVLQYLAAGLPTVAISLNGLKSVLGDDEGVLYAETQHELVSLSFDLLMNEPMRADMAKKGRLAMEEKCNWDVQISTLELLLAELIENSNHE